MIIIRICVGSSCHLKGSQEIVDLLRDEIEQRRLEGEIVLSGSFCFGTCNRVGVTVAVNDDVYPGITRDNFKEFFQTKILPLVQEQ